MDHGTDGSEGGSLLIKGTYIECFIYQTFNDWDSRNTSSTSRRAGNEVLVDVYLLSLKNDHG